MIVQQQRQVMLRTILTLYCSFILLDLFHNNLTKSPKIQIKQNINKLKGKTKQYRTFDYDNLHFSFTFFSFAAEFLSSDTKLLCGR